MSGWLGIWLLGGGADSAFMLCAVLLRVRGPGPAGPPGRNALRRLLPRDHGACLHLLPAALRNDLLAFAGAPQPSSPSSRC